MRQLRSVGTFLIVGSALCFIMAYERYATKLRTAQAIADSIEGVELESVSLPIETTVVGLIGVGLLVAGLKCVFNAFQEPKKEPGELLSSE